MTTQRPRLVLAGTHSGCGKTTVTCAVLQALVERSLRVGAFKCGPDYIDPMFHSRVIGAKSGNLDLFFFPENTLRYLLSRNGEDRDISIIEGVMGYYDGSAAASTAASTYEVARVTDSPVVLVVNARGASLSVLATVQGFLTFQEDSRIAGIILNQCTAATYETLAAEMERRFQGRVKPLGFLPKMAECSLESRHLGLVTADEVAHLREKLHLLAEQAEKTIDLDGLMALAHTAAPLAFTPVVLPKGRDTVRIAVARDRAFCFYYEDSLDALREMGAELVPFSPLKDEKLPEDVQGLYLGGGYPELYAEALSGNTSMRTSVRQALERGLPCIAECGGFMYLTERIGAHPMVGFLAGDSYDTGHLTRFGYVRLQAERDSMIAPAGETLPAHEFHHWDSTRCGDGFTAKKLSGKSWRCVHVTDRLYAGYPHFHFYAAPQAAARFYETCVKEKERHAGDHETDGH